MTLDLESLQDGLACTLTLAKQGEEVTSFAGVGPLPTFNHQSNWKFHKDDNQLYLYDPVDEKGYHFQLPEGAHKTDTVSAFRSADVAKDAIPSTLKSGLAQVHRSDPGSIYVTLHDGTDNPTYTIRHVGASKWHFIPKKRANKPVVEPIYHVKKAECDFTELKKGFLEKISDAPWYDPVAGAGKLFHAIGSGVKTLGENPMASGLAGAGLGLAYDQGRRHLYNTPEENAQETLGQRALRIALPTLALGGTGAIVHNGFPDAYPQ